MAKQTLLQMINIVLANLGESQIVAVNNLSGISLLAFNTLNELLYDISFSDRLSPLENTFTMTLTSNVSTYAMDSTMYGFDKDSFVYDNNKDIIYYTPQRYDRECKTDTSTAQPDKIYHFAGNWLPKPVPDSSADGKIIKFRGWKYPSLYNTATATGTSYIPEGFDVTLLADYCTYKIMHYKENAQAQIYYAKVFGDGRNNDGSLSRFKMLFRSPDISDGSIMVEPMEGNISNRSPRSLQGY